MCHIQRDGEAIAAYAFCDKEYPRRIAYSFLNKCLPLFKAYIGEKWKEAKEDCSYTVPEITKLFKDYQTPSKIDKLWQAQ